MARLEPNRREALSLIGLSLMVLPLNGCIFALMRILVGRGLAGALIRAGRTGRTASALTFGRGIAIGTRLAPARIAALPQAHILGPGRRLIAHSKSSASGSEVYIDTSAIFQSRRTAYGFRHYDFEGPVGRSFTKQGDDVVRHQDEDGIFTAIDRISRARRVVEHFTPDGSKIGETRFEQNSDELNILADDAAIESVNAARDALGLQCPNVQAAFDEWQQYKELCGSGQSSYCRQVSSKSTRYRYLREQCVSGN